MCVCVLYYKSKQLFTLVKLNHRIEYNLKNITFHIIFTGVFLNSISERTIL